MRFSLWTPALCDAPSFRPTRQRYNPRSEHIICALEAHMPHIGDRREMEAFVRAIELRSFTAAARELKLTPSALSKLVTRLERSLRVRLLNRSTRRIAPTPEGELFVAR